MADRCLGVTKDGNPCGAKPLPGSDRCPWHDPTWAERRQEWSKKGGRGRSNEARARKKLAGDVRDMSDVKARLMVALAKVEEGDLEPGPANAMANLARAIATVAGVADFELQLADLRREVADLAESRGA
jgi:hypothetical protein